MMNPHPHPNSEQSRIESATIVEVPLACPCCGKPVKVTFKLPVFVIEEVRG